VSREGFDPERFDAEGYHPSDAETEADRRDRIREGHATTRAPASRPPPAEVLGKPSRVVGLGPWLVDNPEAAEFVLEWERMVQKGTCDWSRNRLASYLRAEFGYPFKNDDPIGAWLKNR